MNAILHENHLVNVDSILDKFVGIKHVCMHGSSERALGFANKWAKIFLKDTGGFFTPVNILEDQLFNAYRVGDVLSISHGMGSTSIFIMLNFLTQLMYKSGNTEFEYIRLGTCGGIGVDPGTVVLTQNVFLPDFSSHYKMDNLDQDLLCEMKMNQGLNSRILKSQPTNLDFKIIQANSLSATDFYLGQARRDGAITPKFSNEDKVRYFDKASNLGIVNIEMESAALSAFCIRFNIPATMVAVALVNRKLGDQVTSTSEELSKFSDHAQDVVMNYLVSSSNG